MKFNLLFLFCTFLCIACTQAQETRTEKAKKVEKPEGPASTDLPYYQIPEYPESYSAGTVSGRLVDGLGYRYYWATEGLTEKDLEYRPSEDARTAGETLDHLLGLSNTIVNAATLTPNIRPSEELRLTFEQKRKKTLNNLKTASDIFKKSSDTDLEKMMIIFQRGDDKSEFPFWHHLNGPIADALTHVGQIVSFRRSSGNPQNPKVSVFRGKTRE